MTYLIREVSPPCRQWLWQLLVAWLTFAITALFLAGFAVVFGACTKYKPVPVNITLPAAKKIDCSIPDLPSAPEVQSWPENESDVFRRTMVSKREHDDLLNFVRDLHHWAGVVRECLEELGR